MPHFTRLFQRGMPLVEMIVGPSHARILALEGLGQTGPSPQRIQALLDTGASNTIFHPSIFDALRIPASSWATLQTASTGVMPRRVNSYEVSVILPGNAGMADALTIPSLRVTESDLDLSQGFQALIGRDILAHCLLTCNGAQGWLTLAY